MQLEILTPNGRRFSGEVRSVILPGASGSFEVLNNHAPLISNLDKGVIRVRAEGQDEQRFEVDGGLVEVLHNRINVLV
jgi:F-type H+-transporting ATPase subunit epsilon